MGFTNTANFGQKSAFVEKRILDLELLAGTNGLSFLDFYITLRKIIYNRMLFILLKVSYEQSIL